MPVIPVIDEPLSDRVHRLASPAFTVSPPIRHAQTRRGTKTPHVLEALWNVRTVSTHAVDFYRLRNVFVTATGLVFDEQARLFRASIGYSPEADVAAAAWAVNRVRHSGDRLDESGPAVLCTQPAMHPHFHWLTAGLPRAMLARAELGLPGLRYVVAHVPEPLRTMIHQSLDLAGLAAADIIEVVGAPRFFAELFLIDGLADPELYLSPLVARCLEGLGAAIPAGQAERLFIVSPSTAADRLAHADALARIALREGYVVTDPALISVTGQIGLFKGASHAVGLGGAQLAGALFMREGSHIGALMPAGAIDNGGWLISQLKRHRYAELLDGNPPPAAGQSSPALRQRAAVAIGEAAFRRFLRNL